MAILNTILGFYFRIIEMLLKAFIDLMAAILSGIWNLILGNARKKPRGRK